MRSRPANSLADERNRILEPCIRFGAAHPEETATRLAKAFAAETGDPASLVRALEEVQGQAVRRDLVTVAHGRHRGKRVETSARHGTDDPIDRVEARHERLDLAAELLHPLVTVAPIVLHRRDAGHLSEGRDTRQRRVRERVEHRDRARAAHRKPESPPAHPERLAERVRRDTLIDHPWLAEDGVMAPVPDHAVVRLIAKYHNAPPPNQSGQLLEVGRPGDATGRVVGAVQKNRLRAGIIVEEPPHIVEVGSKRAYGPQDRHTDPAAATGAMFGG